MRGLEDLELSSTADLLDLRVCPKLSCVVRIRCDCSLIVLIAVSAHQASDKECYCAKDNIEQLLSFASSLFFSLKSAHAHQSAGLRFTMRIVTGPITLLDSSAESTQIAIGNAAYCAEAMAAVAAPDVHESALWRWAAATRRLPPGSDVITLESGERRRAGAYDLERGCFRWAGSDSESLLGARRPLRSLSVP
jgi:hypothetical protein